MKRSGVVTLGIACLVGIAWLLTRESRHPARPSADFWIMPTADGAGTPTTIPATRPARDVGCCDASILTDQVASDLRYLEEIIAESAEALTKRAEREAHLQGVKRSDAERYARMDLSPAEIENASSEELCRFFCLTFASELTLYDDLTLGAERMANSSPSLKALIARPDTVEGILRYGKSVDWESVETLEDRFERGSVTFIPLYIDGLLMYEPIFARTKGRETEVLTMLVDRYQRIVAIEKRAAAAGREPAYSAVSVGSGAKLALLIWHRLDPQSARAETDAGRLETLADIYGQVEKRFLRP
jgi:hypothetical protein